VGLQETRSGLSFQVAVPAFCGMMLLLVGLHPAALPHPVPAAAAFLALALLAPLLVVLARRRPAWGPLVLGAGTMVLLFGIYSALSLVMPWFLPEPREWFLLGIDRRVLGYTWEGWWSWAAAPGWTDLLQAFYTSFYVFPLLLGAALFVKRDMAGFYTTLDRVLVGFLVSYCGYLLVPARSPYDFLSYGLDLPTFGLRPLLHDHLVNTSWTRHDCFPSGHTMMSGFVAWLSWQRARGVFWILGPWALLTMTATLYLRYHYLVDVLAGLAFLAGWILVSERLFGPIRKAGGGGLREGTPQQ